MADQTRDPGERDPADETLVREMVDYFITRVPWAPASEMRWSAGEFIKQAREGYVPASELEAARARVAELEGMLGDVHFAIGKRASHTPEGNTHCVLEWIHSAKETVSEYEKDQAKLVDAWNRYQRDDLSQEEFEATIAEWAESGNV